MKKKVSMMVATALFMLCSENIFAETSDPCSSIPDIGDKDSDEFKEKVKALKLTCVTKQLDTASSEQKVTTADKIDAIAAALGKLPDAPSAPKTPDDTRLAHIGEFQAVRLLRDGVLEVISEMSIPEQSKKYTLSTDPNVLAQRLSLQAVVASWEQQVQSVDALVKDVDEMLAARGVKPEAVEAAPAMPAAIAALNVLPVVAKAIAALKPVASYFQSGALSGDMQKHVIENTVATKSWAVLPGASSSRGKNSFVKAHDKFLTSVRQLKSKRFDLNAFIDKKKNELDKMEKAKQGKKDGQENQDKDKLIKAMMVQLSEYQKKLVQVDDTLKDADAAEKQLDATPTGSTVTNYTSLWVLAQSIDSENTNGLVIIYPVQAGSSGMLITRNFFLHDKLAYESSLSLAYFVIDKEDGIKCSGIKQLYGGFIRDQIEIKKPFDSESYTENNKSDNSCEQRKSKSAEIPGGAKTDDKQRPN